jgi:hypothetical protein
MTDRLLEIADKVISNIDNSQDWPICYDTGCAYCPVCGKDMEMRGMNWYEDHEDDCDLVAYRKEKEKLLNETV